MAKSIYPFVAVTGRDLALSSGMHTCTSEFIVAFIAVLFECSNVADIPLHRNNCDSLKKTTNLFSPVVHTQTHQC